MHIQIYASAPEQLSSAIRPGPVTLVSGIQCPLRDNILLRSPVSSKTSTGNINDSGLEGTPLLFRIPQSTQTPQISIQPVHKLLSYPPILDVANIQPRLGLYHSPGFNLQLQSCSNKPVVSIEELSTPVDPAVLDHPPATINEHMLNLLCHTLHWNNKSRDEPVGAETMNQPPQVHDLLQSQETSFYSGSQFQTHGDQHMSHNHSHQFQSRALKSLKMRRVSHLGHWSTTNSSAENNASFTVISLASIAAYTEIRETTPKE